MPFERAFAHPRRDAARRSHQRRADRPPVEEASVFVARQPLFDNRLRVFAYELLFREAADQTTFPAIDPNVASSRVMVHGLATMGWNTLTNGRFAFLNVTRELLLNGQLTLLPTETVVLEIVEDIVADEEAVAACRLLRRAGYRIALDDFTWQEASLDFLPLADLVKIDVRATDAPERRAVIQRLRRRGIEVIAEKVETREEFSELNRLGCSYFQGYFFQRPEIVSGRHTPGFAGNYAALLAEANRPEVDFGALKAIIKRDVSLVHLFLTHVNAAAFGWRQRITSVRHALVLLGQQTVQRYVSLLALAAMAQGRPDELAVSAAVRARFSESLAPLTGWHDRAFDLFLLGMFSNIDAILDQPLAEAVTRLPIADDVRAALLGAPGFQRDVLALARAYEAGAWASVDAATSGLNVPLDALPAAYAATLEWAELVFPAAVAGR